MEGGTFSVTALGMYSVDAFTPVINPQIREYSVSVGSEMTLTGMAILL